MAASVGRRTVRYEFGHRPLLTQIRAVAVVLVLLFHAGVIDHGFLGVDVFFVLSGFLISNILWDALRSERRTRTVLTEFFTKRVKRLLPLSLVVTAVTAIAAPLLFDTIIETWRESARASLLWFQNWFLIGESNDYFAAEGANPFQHYWSLGIEEQFYVALPIAMAAIVAVTRRVAEHLALLVFGFVAALGAGVSLWANLASESSESYLYFATHLRAYQLLFGCVAMVIVRTVHLESRSTVVAGATVVGLTIASSLGGASVLGLGITAAALSAVLIVGAEHVELHSPLLTRIGLWSYGIYLWHFPVNEYLIHQHPDRSPAVVFVTVAAVSVALSAISYRVLEEPIRRSGLGAVSAMTLTGVAIAGLFVAIGLAPSGADEEIFLAGDPAATVSPPPEEGNQSTSQASVDLERAAVEETRLRASDVRHLSGWVPLVETSVGTCGHWNTTDACVDTEGDFSVMLIGDSFGNQAYHAIRALADENGWQLGAFVRPGCPWMLDVYLNGAQADLCRSSKPLFDEIYDHLEPDVVIIHGHPWARSQRITLVEGDEVVVGQEIIDEALESIAELTSRGARVVFLESTPFAPGKENVRNCLEVATWADECDFVFDRYEDPMSDAMNAAALTDADLQVVSLNHLICDEDECSSTLDGISVMADSTHVSGGLFVYLRHELHEQMTFLPQSPAASVTG